MMQATSLSGNNKRITDLKIDNEGYNKATRDILVKCVNELRANITQELKFKKDKSFEQILSDAFDIPYDN